jgi:hypothetical protein
MITNAGEMRLMGGAGRGEASWPAYEASASASQIGWQAPGGGGSWSRGPFQSEKPEKPGKLEKPEKPERPARRRDGDKRDSPSRWVTRRFISNGNIGDACPMADHP